MTSKQRRHAIVEVLSTGRRVSMRELSERFGVTRRTIRLDIDFITKFYNLDISKGHKGGVLMVGSLGFDHQMLTYSEQSLLEKLQVIVSEEDANTLQRIILKFGWCG